MQEAATYSEAFHHDVPICEQRHNAFYKMHIYTHGSLWQAPAQPLKPLVEVVQVVL